MKLEDVLRLRPAEGAASATLVAAIATAETARRDALARVAAAEATRRDLLGTDDKQLATAARDAEQAQLAAERIGLLLPQMRDDLAAAEGRETLAALRAEHAEVEQAQTALTRWHEDELPELQDRIGRAFRIENAAMNARARFLANVAAAYEHDAVRDAGPLGITLSDLPTSPRALFPGWSMT